MSATPVTQKVNKEAIRVLVVQHGQREAARLAGLNENTVRSWALRYGWSKQIRPQPERNHVHPIADNVATKLATYENETRSGLAKYARQAIGQINASVHPAKYTTEAHNVAKTAAIVHRWDAKSENSQNVVVNVALLGVQPSEVSVETIDVESGVSR